MFEFVQLGGESREAQEPPPREPWGFLVFSHDMAITDVLTAITSGHVLGRIANNKFPVPKRSRHDVTGVYSPVFG